MDNLIFKSFTNDLLNLYLKTKSSSIEKLFITASMWPDKGIAQIHPSNWLKNNSSVKKMLKNPLVYDALVIMEGLRDSLKGLGPQQMMVEMFKISGKALSVVPIIQLFNNFLGDESINDLLDPYKDIIKNLAALPPVPGVKEAGEEEKAEIYDDLNTIVNKYDEAVESGGQEAIKTQKAQKMDMFSNLLQKFSAELADVFQRANIPEAAQAVQSGALAQPNVMGRAYPLAPITAYKSETAQHIVDEVMRNYRPTSVNRNYEFIKDQVLTGIGMKSSVEEDIEDINIEKFMNPNSEERQKHYNEIMQKPEKTLSLTDEQWLHPPVITFLTIIFYLMRKKMYAR